MISQCEKCGARGSKPKNIDTKHIKIIEIRRNIKKIQYFYQIILLEIQVRGIFFRLMIISVSLDMQL